MKSAAHYGTFVLLLYLKVSCGQQIFGNNQNGGLNNGMGLQQALQWSPNNANQIPNGGFNSHSAQQPNFQSGNLQQSPNLSGAPQGNLPQSMNLPNNLQSQSASVPQNNFQITKMGFSPVASGTVNNPFPSTGQLQNTQVYDLQNILNSNSAISQMANSPISMSTLAELAALKGQPSLLSLLNIPSNCQSQQNQLTDVQKQFLVRAIQAQSSGQNQQGINFVQTQPRTDNQQTIAIRTIQGTPQQVQAVGNQPTYAVVQAQPRTYVQQTPPTTVEEEPSVISLILSELGSQYSMDSAYPPPKKGSKPNIKTLIPLIINMLKEKNNCRNCGCPNTCNNPCTNTTSEAQMAQIFGGYSNQKSYGQSEVKEVSPPTRIKKNDDEESRVNDKKRKIKEVVVSEEVSEEDDSDYTDDADE